MYYFIYGFLYLFSLLPIRILYFFSDATFLLIYYLFKYRKTVVFSNIKQAFPDKSDKEIKIIAQKFYHNITDSFVETIKLISASDKFIRKRFYGDFSVFHYLYEKGKKCHVHTSHNFNWEYANFATPLYISHTMLTVYMPIKNKIVDKLLKKIRTRTGAILLPATTTRSAILPFRNTQYALILVADQNPSNLQSVYWVNFLHKSTAFLRGPESGARRGNIPVIFSYFIKEKRGFYKIINFLAEENPANTQPGELTLRYVRFLEEMIRKSPEMWLWSHKRWKHSWKPEYKDLWVDKKPAPIKDK